MFEQQRNIAARQHRGQVARRQGIVTASRHCGKVARLRGCEGARLRGPLEDGGRREVGGRKEWGAASIIVIYTSFRVCLLVSSFATSAGHATEFRIIRL